MGEKLFRPPFLTVMPNTPLPPSTCPGSCRKVCQTLGRAYYAICCHEFDRRSDNPQSKRWIRVLLVSKGFLKDCYCIPPKYSTFLEFRWHAIVAFLKSASTSRVLVVGCTRVGLGTGSLGSAVLMGRRALAKRNKGQISLLIQPKIYNLLVLSD